MRLLLFFTLWILNRDAWTWCEKSVENRSIERWKRGFEGEYLVFPEGSNVQPVKKPSNQIFLARSHSLDSISKSFDSCAAGVLHDHHYLLQASRNVQHRIDGWPGMGAALEEHPVQQVQGLSSSKQKRAVSQVGTTFGKILSRTRWKDIEIGSNVSKGFIINLILRKRKCGSDRKSVTSIDWWLLQKFSREFRGKDGRGCVLKAICNAAGRSRRDVGKGPFMREILHAVFTLPASYDDGDPTTEYERAYFLKENCNEAEWKCPDVFSDNLSS
ncbi:uncharacterized protein LOC122713351 isoform X1 [Apis laboriosa]|uniref:uncharacterized protein LOC122713351 isoform X1 n=1 Tax=Apis laboriosa TaxID=183418 RepID=UPI001CC60D80|nr:uncharacterized protein LOC122713351 isoform X1 [Apis laboriosa]